MCLASEAGKNDTGIVPQEDSSSSSTVSLQQTGAVEEMKEEKADTEYCVSTPHTSALLPSLSSVTSTSTDAILSQLGSQNPCVKKKSKKKESAKTSDISELLCSTKKIIKKYNDTESHIDSVFSTIVAVAKGAFNDPRENVKKNIQSNPSDGHSAMPKKKSKSKVITFIKDMDSSSGQCGQDTSPVEEMKEDVTAVGSKIEMDEASTGITDLQGIMAEPHCSPCTHSSAKPKEEEKGQERQSEVSCESNEEHRGFRKSERTCKGALYKTLVSEGMLTSLRANIDRGINLI